MPIIAHAGVITPGGRLADQTVVIEGSRIAALLDRADAPVRAGQELLDGSGLILAPGFIDLQVNGAFGRDFTADPSCIWDVAREYARYGVTAFLPTIITAPPTAVRTALAVLAARPAGFRGAEPLGLHCEGPFLNPAKKGAHNPAYLRPPSVEGVTGWAPEDGVRLVTLAPELPGALDVVQALRSRGVVVSAGHSLATYDEAVAGFDAGITFGTHLFNAMPALGHRDPGLPGALLTDPRATCGFIADGIHTHPALIRLIWQALGPDRLCAVTDCMAALGMPEGKHVLGDYEVTVERGTVRLADGTLAGSVLSMDQALRNLVRETGCAVEDALRTMTATPARVLGLGGERGQVAPGRRADLVLLSPDLRVQATLVAGEVVYRA